MFQLVYCVGGSLKNLCHFEMGGGGVWQMLTLSGGGGSLNADRGEGGKICQNLADVVCERSLRDMWVAEDAMAVDTMAAISQKVDTMAAKRE